jgi:hypothetical protein
VKGKIAYFPKNYKGTDTACFDATNRYEPLPRFLNHGELLLAQ